MQERFTSQAHDTCQAIGLSAGLISYLPYRFIQGSLAQQLPHVATVTHFETEAYFQKWMFYAQLMVFYLLLNNVVT